MATEKRFDVVIFEIETRKVESIAGRDMREEGGFHTVDKRLATVSERLNEHYDVMAVPAGKYNKGDVLPEEP
jgi:putative intracellular protease/amidase